MSGAVTSIREMDQRYVANTYRRFPVEIVRGSGSVVWDADGKRYIDMGFYIGIGGMITFPDVKKILRTVKEIPLEKILLETDCPYLAPVPNRGKRNDSRNIPFIAAKIAELKGISVEEVAKVTTENVSRLFGIKIKS